LTQSIVEHTTKEKGMHVLKAPRMPASCVRPFSFGDLVCGTFFFRRIVKTMECSDSNIGRNPYLFKCGVFVLHQINILFSE